MVAWFVICEWSHWYLIQNFEQVGEIDKELCETLMKELLKPKFYGRAEYISSDEFDSENLVVTVLLASEEYNSAYILVRWIGGTNTKSEKFVHIDLYPNFSIPQTEIFWSFGTISNASADLLRFRKTKKQTKK